MRPADARTGADGELIPLDEQNRAQIGLTRAWSSGCFSKGQTVYQIQRIAAVHDEAARVEETDWPEIRALYGLLMTKSDNPMVALNHAIAVAMVDGPAAGLAPERPDTDARLGGHYRLMRSARIWRWPATRWARYPLPDRG
jgi:predicted RNA polymerase sigma factor